MSRQLLPALLALLVLNGCATAPSVEYIKPRCAAPALPDLPNIDAGALWDAVGPERYNELLRRDEMIAGWAAEMRAMIGQLCDNG